MNRKQYGGRKAKTSGDEFENLIQSVGAIKKIKVIKIPSGARYVKTKTGLALAKARSPFDFILLKNGKAAFIDAKSINAERFPKSLITHHQALTLKDCELQGFPSGYLIYFRPLNRVVFFASQTLLTLPAGKSLTTADGLLIGSIYEMDLEKLF